MNEWGFQARSQGRKSDEARPGGRAKISENPKFLKIFSDEKYKYEATGLALGHLYVHNYINIV